MEFGPAGAEAHVEVLARHHETGWMDDSIPGELWVARDGDAIVGAVELISVGDGAVVEDAAVVKVDRLGHGNGAELMWAVLNSREAEWWTECPLHGLWVRNPTC